MYLSGYTNRRSRTASSAWINIDNKGSLSRVRRQSTHKHTHTRTHTHIHTYIHHDKLIAISAPPYYVQPATIRTKHDQSGPGEQHNTRFSRKKTHDKVKIRQSPFTTPGQETGRVHSFSPRAHMGPGPRSPHEFLRFTQVYQSICYGQ